MPELKKGARLDQTVTAKAAIQMTKEEAAQSGKELERAHGVSYALRAQLWQESAQHDSWLEMLDELEQAKPWMYLPEGNPAGEFWKWMAQTYELPGGVKVTKDRLHAILTSFANEQLEARAIEFYERIDSPLFKGKLQPLGGAPKGNSNAKKNNRNPDNGCLAEATEAARRGTSKAYLLDRLMREHPGIEEEIGPKPKPYSSVQAAAIAKGLIPARKRYEVNPDASIANAAKRIHELFGDDKTAELITHLTALITK
jgi:hypothetical protein